MYINFWYAAERSENVTDKPVKVRMLGQDLVLFRDAEGKARCLANTCVHRGGSLGGGKLRNGRVECPYHGWQFEGDGRCARIPSLGLDASIPARARVDSYPVEERYGLVFAFLGDLPEDERPGILEVKEWGQPGWTCLPIHVRVARQCHALGGELPGCAPRRVGAQLRQSRRSRRLQDGAARVLRRGPRAPGAPCTSP